MLQQDLAGGEIILSVVVVALPQTHNFEAWKFLAQDMAKAHFALFMAAIAEAAGDHRDFRRCDGR